MKRFLLIFHLITTVILSGCNGDIFIDGDALPYETDITLDGDGGTATLEIPLKGLQYIGMQDYSSHYYCTYFNADGEIIGSHAPVTEIARIIYETDFNRLEIYRHGTRLIITSVCNASDERHDIIHLEYSYGNRYIELKILPGRPLSLESVHYNSDIMINGGMTTDRKMHVENAGASALSYKEFPYLNDRPFVMIDPLSSMWAKFLTVDMSVPVYENGEWVFRVMTGIRLGVQNTYPGPDMMTWVEIPVPPFSKQYVTTLVNYDGAEVSGTLYFLNEIIGRRIPVNFNLASYYPVSFDIKIDEQ